MNKLFLLLVFCFTSLTISAQDFALFQKAFFVNSTDTMPYRILFPKNYDSSKTYPLLLFLHGAGERGNDNEKQLSKAGSLFMSDSLRKNYPAIVVFPQCSFFSFWSNVRFGFDTINKRPLFIFQQGGEASKAMKMAMGLVKELLVKYRVKNDQVYVGGLSMGGMGTFEMVNRMPGVFAAAFPICGGANPETAPALIKTSWWVFHGEKDPVVPFHFSQDMVFALRKNGAAVKFTEYPEASHNSWDRAFKEPDLLRWLFSQRLTH